jgi:predicted ATPase/DNA-binding SARP family transcriptional activator
MAPRASIDGCREVFRRALLPREAAKHFTRAVSSNYLHARRIDDAASNRRPRGVRGIICAQSLISSFVFPMSRLSLILLGDAVIRRGDAVITRLRSAKARALLLRVALENEHAHTRESLCDMFWGEQTSRQARHNLSQAIFYLQHALGKDTVARVLDISRTAVQFKTNSDAYVDAHEFLALLRACETHPHRRIEACAACAARLERACTLYRGELLAQFFLDDCPAFEEWLLVQREHFQRLAITALGHLTAYYEAQGAASFADTIRCARRQLQLEVWREEPYRVLMRTYAAMNQPDAALVEYHALAHILHQELGLAPSAETNALYKHLRAGALSSVIGLHSSIANLQPPTSNLPVPTTPLVGRATELAQLSEKIARADCRLLTLVGQGGIGKTRLALQTAHDNLGAFPRGAHFVDLADVDSADLIPNAIADALQFQFRGAASGAQQIVEHLRAEKEPLLLVLDNFEPLLDGTPFVSELLKRAPNVTLLVTSRERLNVEGEWLFQVEGLRAAANIPTRAPDDWDASEAVQLLAQCAARVNVNSQLWRDDEKRAAMRITHLVEGMPLAIELASAWLRTLTPVEIADEIARGLDAFEQARRDAPKRHASIRAVFEHSWKLLTPPEQHVFAQLAVFRGGMTREAAREIAGASLPILSALVEKSLVKRAAAGRFRLHELVRQFAAEKLIASNRFAQTQSRHSAYFLNLVARRAASFNDSGAQTLLEELRHELDNLRHAWRVASLEQNLVLLDASLSGLCEFYLNLALYQEGVEQLRFAAAQLGDVRPAWAARAAVLHSRLLAQIARLKTKLTQYPDAIAAAQHAIELGTAAKAPEAIAAGYLYWGYAVRRQGDYARAREILGEAAAHARKAHLPLLEMEARTYLGGTFWNESAYAQARDHWSEALALSRAQGNLRQASLLLNNLGILYQELGDFVRARDCLDDALRLCKTIGTDALWGAVLCNLGLLDLDQYAFDSARAGLNQALHFYREIGTLWAEHLALLGLGQLSGCLGDYERAREELEAAARGLDAAQAETDHARALGQLGLVYANLGQRERARTAVEKGIAIARTIRDRFTLGKGLLILGHIALEENDLTGAHDAYADAQVVYAQLKLYYLQMEAQAGAARVLWARNELEAARGAVEPVYQFLRAQPLEGSDEPLRVYWTCYQILRACGDARADEVLTTAHALVHSRADAIRDAAARTMFLENVRWNREIETAYENGETFRRRNGPR